MWEKGQSGNPHGRPKRASFIEILERAIIQDDGKRIRGACEKLLDLANDGEPWAVQMLADRLDGKPKQQTEISGPEGGPIQTQGVPPLNFDAIRETVQSLRSDKSDS